MLLEQNHNRVVRAHCVHNVVIDTFDCYIWCLSYSIGDDIKEVDVWICNKYSNMEMESKY